MTNLGAEEEVESCHYQFELPKHSLMFYGFWVIFIVIIVVMTHFNDYSEPIVPWVSLFIFLESSH